MIASSRIPEGFEGGPRRIRPYKLFALLDSAPPQRVAQFQIPPRRGAGGITLLETALLIASMKIVSAKRVFEFGTFLGSTTLNLALNLSDDGHVFTLDLDYAPERQHPSDAPLSELHFASRPDFEGSAVAHKITQLRGNSRTFNFSPLAHSIDLVFIDGGHDEETVQSDTENAMFKLLAQARPTAVLWHDYGNPEYPDLTCCLDNLAFIRPIFHVEDTMLCVWFSNPNAVQRLAEV